MWTLACEVHVLWLQQTNSHGLQKSYGGKGTAWPLSKWERGPDPCLDRLLLLFWVHYIEDGVGDYLLQITKERMLLITAKRRIKRKSGWTGYTPYLGGLAQTLAVNICCLNPGWGSFSKSESHSSLGTMQVSFPMGKPICERGSCVPTSLPTGLSK